MMNSNKEQFPLFVSYKKRFGANLCYLDSAGTSLTPKVVISKIEEYYTDFGLSNDRSLFGLAFTTSNLYEDVRKKVASFISVKESEVIFTSGATMAAHAIIESLKKLYPRDVFLVSITEHHSVLLPLLRFKREGGLVDVFEGLPHEHFIARIKETKPKVVLVQQVSNVTGEEYDVTAISTVVHEYGGIVICDASQSVGHKEVSVSGLGVDVLFFSAHKMCGPKGIGVLFVKQELLKKIQPTIIGGGTVTTVSVQDFTLLSGVPSFEAGTQNIAGVFGLGAAIDFLEDVGLKNIEQHVRDLTEYIYSKLSEVKGVHLVSTKDSLGIISFYVEGVHSHDIAQILSDNHIAIRAGFMCAEPLITKISSEPLIRFSLYLYSSRDDIDYACETLEKAIRFFKK